MHKKVDKAATSFADFMLWSANTIIISVHSHSGRGAAPRTGEGGRGGGGQDDGGGGGAGGD